jgi:hypothetical protein
MKRHIPKINKISKGDTLKHARFSLANIVIFSIIFAAIGGYLIYSSFAATTCNMNATTANFATQVTAATSGQTICLASGSYGKWGGTTKAITVTPDIGAAVTMTVENSNLANVSNFTIDGSAGGGTMTIVGLDLRGSTTTARNLTFKNLAFQQGASAGSMAFIDGPTNSNILFDHDTFNNASCKVGSSGRFHLAYPATAPSGVTVQNSTFDGGSSDGIASGTSLTVLNNRFMNIAEGPDTICHTDAIQLLQGSVLGASGAGTGSIIRGNYFSNSSTGVAAYDGSDAEPVHDIVIENNIFENINAQNAIVLGGDRNSIIVHNTIRAGIPNIDLTSRAGAHSSGEIVRDNIVSTIHLSNGVGGDATPALITRNMLPSGATGTNFNGVAQYQGGNTFTTPANYALTISSPGKNAASDGTDVGADVTKVGIDAGGTTPTPPPPPPSSDTTPPTVSVTAPVAGTTVTGSSVTLSANATDNVGVSGVQFKVDGNIIGAEDTTSPYSVSWNSTQVTNGSHSISATARDAAGNSTTSSSVSVTVSNAATPGGTLLLGTQTVQTVDDTSSAGDPEAFKYTAVATGTAGTLSFYLTSSNTATGLKVGIYSDNAGHPGSLLTSGSVTSPAAGAWATATLSPAVTISNSTPYWIGYVGTGGTLAYRDLSTGSCSENFSAAGQTNLSATWTSGPSWPTCSVSAYVLTASSQTGPKAGDINGDNSVNITDLSLLLSSYGQNTTQCVTNNAYKCDLSSPADGIVNIFDMSILLSNYGK